MRRPAVIACILSGLGLAADAGCGGKGPDSPSTGTSVLDSGASDSANTLGDASTVLDEVQRAAEALDAATAQIEGRSAQDTSADERLRGIMTSAKRARRRLRGHGATLAQTGLFSTYLMLSPLKSAAIFVSDYDPLVPIVGIQPIAVGASVGTPVLSAALQVGGPGLNYLGFVRDSKQPKGAGCSSGNPLCAVIVGSAGLFVNWGFTDEENGRYLFQFGWDAIATAEPGRLHGGWGPAILFGYVPNEWSN